jgi:Sec-independent protein translocase protein TatA
MFGIGPTELAFFLVILLLAVGPDRLPAFMRTVGRGVRQVRNASREFKDAIGLDELMREGDPFRAPQVRPPKAQPVPIEETPAEVPRRTTPPPIPPEAASAAPPPPVELTLEPELEPDTGADADPDAETRAEAKHP